MKEIKEEQESGAQSTEKKVKCPNCKHTIFSRTLVEPVEIIETKDSVTDIIADEPQLVHEFYCCVKCGSILDFDRVVAENEQVDNQNVGDPLTTTQKELAHFTACVFEPTDIVEVRRLPSGKSTWHQADKLAEAAESLVQENRQRQHIYAGANPRRAKGGTKSKDVTCARCLFVDFDRINADVARNRWHDAGLPTPTITIASGHGVHAYWRLTEPITDMALWSKLQKGVITLLDSDLAIHDPARIMRVPGFTNHKEPVAECRIIDDDQDKIYDLKYLMPLLNSAIRKSQERASFQARNGSATHPKKSLRGDASTVKIAKLTAAKWKGVTKGGRNHKAFQNAAYLLKNLGLTEGQAWPILRHWNCKNKPPLPEWELRQALRNANTYGRHPASNKAAG
jgi:hypothetical protein